MKKKELKERANGGSSLAIIITLVITVTVIVYAPVLSDYGQATAIPNNKSTLVTTTISYLYII